MTKSIIWPTRFRRFLFYFSGSALAIASAVLIPAFGIWREIRSQQPSGGGIVYWLIGGILLLVFIFSRNYLEYRRLKYDPHWAMNFQDRFDRLQNERAKAAEVLTTQRAELRDIEKEELANIDDVMDFFEDVGLYQQADHISPELAHHHFFHWTRGYWQAAKPYVQAWRKKEPARWNHVEELFETSCDIELKIHGGTREQLVLNDLDLDRFLKQETEVKTEDARHGWDG